MIRWINLGEALAPFLKNEEARLRAASGVQRSPFQYVLCAAMSPAVKQQEETLSYLNQGTCLKLVEYSDISSKYVKPKGADRKLKTDREKMEKKTPQDREKYQPSHETTLLRE
ncbi:hypothetical protein XENOCAPTIV_030650, partial [Xenoophorus captivus]